jgi:hypothetical protein
VITKWVAAAAVTTMPDWLPVMLELTLSVAVSVPR